MTGRSLPMDGFGPPGGLRRLILATRNAHKATEIRAILRDLPMIIHSVSDFPGIPEPEENGLTLEENARIKATAVHRATGEWALADDSGLEVDALGGAPGVISARFAGAACTFEDNNLKLLELMRDVPDERRTARFRCVAALAISAEHVELFSGEVKGRITRTPQGTGGFGYDPVFYVQELGRSFAEVSDEEKNALSHRGIAFRQAARRLAGLVANTR